MKQFEFPSQFKMQMYSNMVAEKYTEHFTKIIMHKTWDIADTFYVFKPFMSMKIKKLI